MKNVMESMKKDYGYVEFGGEEYVLIQDAYLDGTVYVANAIKVGDEPNDGGFIPLYEVKWEIIYPDTEDEGDRCDWEHPVDIRYNGLDTNVEDGLVY